MRELRVDGTFTTVYGPAWETGGKGVCAWCTRAVQLEEHQTTSHDVFVQANEVTSPARSSMFSSAGGSGVAAHTCGSCASTIASCRSACTNLRSCVPAAKTKLSPSKTSPRRFFDPMVPTVHQLCLCIHCTLCSIPESPTSSTPPHFRRGSGTSACLPWPLGESYTRGGNSWMDVLHIFFLPNGKKQKARSKGVNQRYARERNSHCDIGVRTAPSALNWCVQVVINRRSDQLGQVFAYLHACTIRHWGRARNLS